jgi:hypothetical protein
VKSELVRGLKNSFFYLCSYLGELNMENSTNLVERPTKKRCPKCKEIDVTTFSKCRNCGTRYDSNLQETRNSSVNLGFPLLFCLLAMGGVFAFYQFGQVIHTQSVYSNLDKLIGQTLKCQSAFELVCANQQDLLSMDAEMATVQKNDPKRYGSKGIGGMMSAASALESITSGKETSSSVITRYLRSGRINVAESESRAPLSVSLLAATSPSEKFRLVQVKLLNGSKAGSIWWMNIDQLDLSGR